MMSDREKRLAEIRERVENVEHFLAHDPTQVTIDEEDAVILLAELDARERELEALRENNRFMNEDRKRILEALDEIPHALGSYGPIDKKHERVLALTEKAKGTKPEPISVVRFHDNGDLIEEEQADEA
jgi:hypothetical protein